MVDSLPASLACGIVARGGLSTAPRPLLARVPNLSPQTFYAEHGLSDSFTDEQQLYEQGSPLPQQRLESLVRLCRRRALGRRASLGKQSREPLAIGHAVRPERLEGARHALEYHDDEAVVA